MKKNLLIKSMFLLFALIVGSGTMWAEEKSYTITFQDSGTDKDGSATVTSISEIIADGASYVSSITESSSVYNGRSGRGLKLGSGSNAGSLTLNLATAVTPTKITFYAMQYNNTEKSITVNNYSVTNLTSSLAEYTINYNGITKVSKIEISTSSKSKRAYITKVTVYYDEEDPSLSNSDLALTGASGALTFDLYNNANAQVINYTTSSTGAITIEPATSDYFTYTHNSENKTITVTPVAVTPSAQAVTINQAADDNYKAGTATFTVSVDDSTPFVGAIFDAIKDKGTSPIVKDNVSFACDNGVFDNGSEYRMYKNSTTTISTTDGSTITKIEFTGVSDYAASNFKKQTGWTTSGNDGVWTGEAQSVSFEASGAQVRATVIKVTVSSNSNPSISANNVEIAYDATSGEIGYSILNPVPGSSLNATTESDWISNINVTADKVTFTTTANTGVERTATIALTYTYGDSQTVTKDVTVTQAADPNTPGTENNPYTVAQARAAIDAESGTQGVYATGIVSKIVTAYNSQFGNISYNISTDGSTEGDQLLAYRGKGINGTNFTSDDDIQVGDVVIIYGNLKKHTDGTYEFDANNQLVSLDRPVVLSVADFEIAFNATNGEIEYTIINEPSPVGELSASVSEGTWLTISVVGQNVEFTCSANEATAPRTAKVTLTYTYGDSKTVTREITITQAAYIASGDWIKTDLADLTEDDVFVIVGDNSDTYAMSNNKGTSAPIVVEVTVADNTLSGEIADNIKWNLSGNSTAGYTFYPNGDTESWLYCTSSNNGVKVGTGDANIFTLKNNYLYNTGQERYVGIYNSQDWRCYKLADNQQFPANNIASQSFSFYKKKSANVTLSASGYATYCSDKALDFTNIKKQNYRAWYISKVEGTTVTFTEITGTVKAGEGIILYGTPGAKCSLPYAESGEELSNNKLVGTLAPTAITTVEGDYTNFGLSGGEFKKIASGTIPANKAYLPVLTSSLSSEARLSIVLNDGTTGVNDVRGNVKEISDSIFDLQGRKVSKPTKGLYIMNGKKVFVK